MSEEKVKVLRGFNDGATFAAPGSEITVSSIRAQELELNGLVERSGASKSAPATENKMAPDAANKAKPEPKSKTGKA